MKKTSSTTASPPAAQPSSAAASQPAGVTPNTPAGKWGPFHSALSRAWHLGFRQGQKPTYGATAIPLAETDANLRRIAATYPAEAAAREMLVALKQIARHKEQQYAMRGIPPGAGTTLTIVRAAIARATDAPGNPERTPN